jgi:hypothetical protein
MGIDDWTDAEAEVERLRALVGPEDKDYATLRGDVDAARAAARDAEAGLGELRGKIVELHFQVDRLGQQYVAPQRSLRSRARSAARRAMSSVQARMTSDR